MQTGAGNVWKPLGDTGQGPDADEEAGAWYVAGWAS